MIHAVVKTQHYKGQITKTIRVKTDDPQKPNFTLSIKANIITYYITIPERLALQEVVGKEGVMHLEFRQSEGKAITLKAIKADHPFVQIHVDPPVGTKIQGDETYKISLTFPGDLKENNYPGKLHLTTDFEKAPEYEISYNYNVTPLVRAIPKRIQMSIRPQPYRLQVMEDQVAMYEAPDMKSKVLHTFSKDTYVSIREDEGDYYKVWVPGSGEGYIKKDEAKAFYPGAQASITVYSYDKEKTLKIQKVTSDLDDITWEVKENQPGSSYRITLSYKGPMKEGYRATGNVVIHTNHPQYKAITVPVTINIRSLQRGLPPKRPLSRKESVLRKKP